jgi:hypothetical protein
MARSCVAVADLCCVLCHAAMRLCTLLCMLQELSMWLYALTLLRITPSPSWCAAFVEASFTRFTAPNTRPQVSTLVPGSYLPQLTHTHNHQLLLLVSCLECR